jgi:hypothetical protein
VYVLLPWGYNSERQSPVLKEFIVLETMGRTKYRVNIFDVRWQEVRKGCGEL